MKSTLAHSIGAVAGALLGIASALTVLGNSELMGQFEHDHWIGNTQVGSRNADAYTRAIVARTGLLALERSEAIYFHRYVDDQGARLREGCTYELSGGDLPARWWSITIYAADDFLPVNGDEAASVDASQVAGSAGNWTVRVAPDRADQPHWISTRNAGEFNLALRLYNPHERIASAPERIPYPKVVRTKCDGGER